MLRFPSFCKLGAERAGKSKRSPRKMASCEQIQVRIRRLHTREDPPEGDKKTPEFLLSKVIKSAVLQGGSRKKLEFVFTSLRNRDRSGKGG